MKIIDCIGPYIYVCALVENENILWRRHIDQLLKAQEEKESDNDLSSNEERYVNSKELMGLSSLVFPLPSEVSQHESAEGNNKGI